MTGSESARLALYNRLEELLGNENAETLMSSLPMQPTSHFATTSDTDRLGGRIDQLDQRIDRLERRIEQLEVKVSQLAIHMHAGFAEVHKALRDQHATYTKLMIGSMAALTAIFSVIVGVLT